MNKLVPLVLCFSLSSVLAGVAKLNKWDSFEVTYGAPNSGQGYYGMPWTVNEATGSKKWIKIDEDKRLNVDVYSQPEDPRILLLFDKKGNIAGLRMSFLKDDVAAKAKAGGYSFDFSYDNNPLYEKGNYLGKDLWHATALFVSPSKLASGGRSKPLNKQSDNVAEGLFFKADGVWTELSKNQCSPTKNFFEANCFPGMGKHYFYKLNMEDCTHRQPIFALYDEGELVGMGIGGFGTYSKHPKTQSYYEAFSTQGYNNIIPNGPKCIQEYIEKYGLTLMHIFLKKNASKTTCPATEWKSTHC